MVTPGKFCMSVKGTVFKDVNEINLVNCYQGLVLSVHKCTRLYKILTVEEAGCTVYENPLHYPCYSSVNVTLLQN